MEKKVSSLEIIEVVLAQCNLVDSQCQQKSEVLFTFTPNKSYAYSFNVEPSNLVRKCNAIDKIIFDMDKKTLSLKYPFSMSNIK